MHFIHLCLILSYASTSVPQTFLIYWIAYPAVIIFIFSLSQHKSERVSYKLAVKYTWINRDVSCAYKMQIRRQWAGSFLHTAEVDSLLRSCLILMLFHESDTDLFVCNPVYSNLSLCLCNLIKATVYYKAIMLKNKNRPEST